MPIYFQIMIFKKPLPSKGGWMGDHALYTLLEYLLNLCMIRVVGLSYTLDPHYIFIGIKIDISYICILICIFYICLIFQLAYPYIHIYDLIVLVSHVFKNFFEKVQIMFAKLDLVHHVNYF